MKISLIAGLAALVVVGASPAAAQTADDWASFADATMSQYRSPGDAMDWEDMLFAAFEAHPDDAQAAMGAFAEQIDLPREEAARYAQVIMATVALRERCEGRGCSVVEQAAATADVLADAGQEPSGALLAVIGKALPNDADVMAAFLRHPARVRILAEVYAYNESAPLFALMVLDKPGAAEVLAAMRAEPPQVGSDPDEWDGWLLAILEHAMARVTDDGAPVGDQAVYAQIILTHYLRLGLTEEASAAWLAYPQALRDALPLLPPEGCGVPQPMVEGSHRLPDDSCEERDRGAELMDGLAAALSTTGRRDEARAVLAQGETRLGGAPLMGQIHAAVTDAMQGSRAVDSLFELYVDGDRSLRAPRYHSFDGQGWLSQSYSPAAARLVADRARDAGYAEVAKAIADRQPYYRSDRPGVLAGMAESLPAAVRERQAALSSRIDAAWSAFPERPGRTPARAAVIPALWTESRLPEGLTPWRQPERGREDDFADFGLDAFSADAMDADATEADWDAAEDDLLNLDAAEAAVMAVDAATEAAAASQEEFEAMFAEMEAADTDPSLPVRRHAVVRLDELGDERLLIYRDATYDLPGETGAYGLWFNHSRYGVWGEPVYLGLQEGFPYVIAPESELPLLDGDRLQIEVQVREIDPESITFPPVGLRLKREEDGLVLSASLTELTRDSDADGIPTLVEQRLDLDPANPDIDGDGIPDGIDPLPQVAFDPSAPAGRIALAHAILKQMIGYDADAIVVPVSQPGDGLDDMLAAAVGRPPVPAPMDTFIIGGDPTLFAGLKPPFRLLAYTPEALQALTEKGAPFYPPSVTVYSSLDGRRHFVIWSASWVGGSFIAICNDGATACEIDERSSWIT